MKTRTTLVLLGLAAFVTALVVAGGAASDAQANCQKNPDLPRCNPNPPPPPPPPSPPPPPPGPVCPPGQHPGGKDGEPGNDDSCVPDVTPPPPSPPPAAPPPPPPAPPAAPPPPPAPPNAKCPAGWKAMGKQNGVLLCGKVEVVVKKVPGKTKTKIVFKRYCPKPYDPGKITG